MGGLQGLSQWALVGKPKPTGVDPWDRQVGLTHCGVDPVNSPYACSLQECDKGAGSLKLASPKTHSHRIATAVAGGVAGPAVEPQARGICGSLGPAGGPTRSMHNKTLPYVAVSLLRDRSAIPVDVSIAHPGVSKAHRRGTLMCVAALCRGDCGVDGVLTQSALHSRHVLQMRSAQHECLNLGVARLVPGCGNMHGFTDGKRSRLQSV